MFVAALKILSGLFIHYIILDAIYNTISIISVDNTLSKYKQIKIGLKQFLTFFFEKWKKFYEPAPELI